MDNRTGRRNREPARYVSEVGTDTVPVNLVEIQSVGGRSQRSPLPLFLVSLAVVAIIAFALGGSMATPAPLPTASAAPVAVSSPSSMAPVPSPSGSPRPSATPRVTPLVTPSPTPAPWAWTGEAVPGNPLKPTGIWTIDGQVFVPEISWEPANGGAAAVVARKTPRGDWDLSPMGPAVTWTSTGTKVNGRIWLVARVAGVSQDDFTWELVSSDDGATWESLGPIKGLDQLDGFTSLTRIGGLWVGSALYVTGPCCTGGEYGLHLVWSADGVHWTPADLPKLDAAISFVDVASYGDSLVVIATLGSEIRPAPTVLRSRDGKTWRFVDGHGFQKGDEVYGLSCSDAACAVITARPFCDCLENGPTAHMLTGTSAWNAYDLDLPDSTLQDDSLRSLMAIDRGFIAVAGSSGQAVVSLDGSSWSVFDVIPLARSQPIAGLARLGESILAVTISMDDSPSVLWTGDLTALGF
jgi:hypothetical protein